MGLIVKGTLWLKAYLKQENHGEVGSPCGWQLGAHKTLRNQRRDGAQRLVASDVELCGWSKKGPAKTEFGVSMVGSELMFHVSHHGFGIRNVFQGEFWVTGSTKWYSTFFYIKVLKFGTFQCPNLWMLTCTVQHLVDQVGLLISV